MKWVRCRCHDFFLFLIHPNCASLMIQLHLSTTFQRPEQPRAPVWVNPSFEYIKLQVILQSKSLKFKFSSLLSMLKFWWVAIYFLIFMTISFSEALPHYDCATPVLPHQDGIPPLQKDNSYAPTLSFSLINHLHVFW